MYDGKLMARGGPPPAERKMPLAAPRLSSPARWLRRTLRAACDSAARGGGGNSAHRPTRREPPGTAAGCAWWRRLAASVDNQATPHSRQTRPISSDSGPAARAIYLKQASKHRRPTTQRAGTGVLATAIGCPRRPKKNRRKRTSCPCLPKTRLGRGAEPLPPPPSALWRLGCSLVENGPA